METWTVVYKDTGREEVVERGQLGEDGLKRFDAAAKTGLLCRREVAGMWIVNDVSEEGDVVRIYGRVGREMHFRHAARQGCAQRGE